MVQCPMSLVVTCYQRGVTCDTSLVTATSDMRYYNIQFCTLSQDTGVKLVGHLLMIIATWIWTTVANTTMTLRFAGGWEFQIILFWISDIYNLSGVNVILSEDPLPAFIAKRRMISSSIWFSLVVGMTTEQRIWEQPWSQANTNGMTTLRGIMKTGTEVIYIV